MDNCRIYVCKHKKNECIEFKDMFEYNLWLNKTPNVHEYSFQPVCNELSKNFDKYILIWRNFKY